MRLVTFDPFRALDIPGTSYLKPELALRHATELRSADWALFPPSWLANTLAYGLKLRIFPSLGTYHLGYDKIEMTRAFWAVAPAHVPRTLILPAGVREAEGAAAELGLPLVAKEPRSAMGRGVHLVDSHAALRTLADRASVLYLQEYLPIDRDLRIVWVGDKVLSAYWRIGAPGAFLNNVAQGGRLSFDDIPPAALDLVARIAGELGIDHAGFDLAEVEGHFYLLEFNPFFGNEGLRRQNIRPGPVICDYLHRRTFPVPPEAPRPHPSPWPGETAAA